MEVSDVNSKKGQAYKLRSTLVGVYRNRLKIVSTIGPFEKCNLSPQKFQLMMDVFRQARTHLCIFEGN